MLQSQGFLTTLGIPYFQCQTQADIDAFAQAVIACRQALITGTYATKGLTPSAPPAFYDITQINKHWAAVQDVETAVQAGNLAAAHAALDQANAIGAAMGFPVITAKPDIEILCNAPGWIGSTARAVSQDNFPVTVNGVVTTLADPAVDAVIAKAIATTPTPAPAPVPGSPTYYDLPGPLPGYVSGQTVTEPDGSKWTYCVLPFGPAYRLVKVAMILLALFCGIHAARAQVVVKVSAEPATVTLSQLATAHGLTRYLIEACNVGSSPVTLSAEQLSIGASSIAFVDSADATATISADAQKTFWGRVKQYGPIAGQIAALVLAHQGTISASTGLTLSIASNEAIPLAQATARTQAPTGAALLTQQQYPVTLAASGSANSCFTDHRFGAASAKKGTPAAPVIVTIVAGGIPVQTAPASSPQVVPNAVRRQSEDPQTAAFRNLEKSYPVEGLL